MPCFKCPTLTNILVAFEFKRLRLLLSLRHVATPSRPVPSLTAPPYLQLALTRGAADCLQFLKSRGGGGSRRLTYCHLFFKSEALELSKQASR